MASTTPMGSRTMRRLTGGLSGSTSSASTELAMCISACVRSASPFTSLRACCSGLPIDCAMIVAMFSVSRALVACWRNESTSAMRECSGSARCCGSTEPAACAMIAFCSGPVCDATSYTVLWSNGERTLMAAPEARMDMARARARVAIAVLALIIWT
eukprot:Amastigsp_a680465_5.p3 type:complete len:157 gc:universal Amastigsp_a680465_5:491-21(-)